MLPGAARRRVGVEHDVLDAASAQVVRRRQAGLSGADHDRVEDLHALSNNGAVPDVLRSGLAEPGVERDLDHPAERLLALLRASSPRR